VKVLVAEDDPHMRKLASDVLSTIGVDVITAHDGPSALQIARAQLPDLVVLDIDMPGMNGFEVCATLKSNAETAQIPVLMLTAKTGVDERVYGLEVGADDYLSKPYSPRELIARVETRLRAKSASDDLRERQELLRHTFERFVHASVVEQILQDPRQVKLGGRLQEVTVMFVDLEGFTAMSEHTEPEELLRVLNLYHSLIVNLILESNGTIDKFLGDGVMALYNTPLPQENHALIAVRTALRIRSALASFYEDFPPSQRMGINVGIHTGQAVVGNVGTDRIMDFTAVGDTVNLAARLQGLCHNSQILISGATYEQVCADVIAEPMGAMHVKNRTEAVMTYEILELKR
jgi:adenylate cyclase